MRAVILISAQLIAVFIQEIDILNWSLGIVLCSTLVLSQVRAFQIWLASIKKDKNCLLPRIQQNFKICISTNYLALATIYDKVRVEASNKAIEQANTLEAERQQLMSFSAFKDEDPKSKSKSAMKDKLARCKCCRWSSPKFYQLLMNDIPLIFCLPFAFIFSLMDTVNVGVAGLLTLSDLIAMLVYLSYDDELRFDTDKVYAQAEKRLVEQNTLYCRLMSENVSMPDLSQVDIQVLGSG